MSALPVSDQQPLVVGAGKRARADPFGRLRGAGERAIAVREAAQRGLELPQRRGGLVRLEQELGEQLAHRRQQVLHRDILAAALLHVRRRARKRDGIALAPLAQRNPRRRRLLLDLDLAAPIGIMDRGELRFQPRQLGARGLGRRNVAAARSAERTAEP